MSDPDQSARIHRASQDPAFPAQRERAYGLIVSALDALLTPRGYSLKGSTWTKPGPQGKSAVHLQRSRYGWDVQILLRFVTAGGLVPNHPDWPGDDDITLAHFFDRVDCDPGTLAYMDVLEQPDWLSAALEILTDQALPWLEELHSLQG